MRQVVIHGTALVVAVTAGDQSDDPLQTPPETSMQITITIGDQRFTATLDDT